MKTGTGEGGKPGEPWVEPRGWVGRRKVQVVLSHHDVMHVTLTGGTEKHLWARLIALKSVPVQTGPLARSPLVCVYVCSGEQRQKGSNIASQQSRRIEDGRFWARKRVSDAELFLV